MEFTVIRDIKDKTVHSVYEDNAECLSNVESLYMWIGDYDDRYNNPIGLYERVSIANKAIGMYMELGESKNIKLGELREGVQVVSNYIFPDFCWQDFDGQSGYQEFIFIFKEDNNGTTYKIKATETEVDND